MTSYVYILVFQNKDYLKIGKSVDIYSRISTLKNYWGEVDYKNSYYITTTQEHVFYLEKAFHNLLNSYRFLPGEGPGKTEFFSLKSIDFIEECTDLYSRCNNLDLVLIKSINKPKNQLLKINNSKKPIKINCISEEEYSIRNMQTCHNFYLFICYYKPIIKLQSDFFEIIVNEKVIAQYLFLNFRFRLNKGGINFCTGMTRELDADEFSLSFCYPHLNWNSRLGKDVFEILISHVSEQVTDVVVK